MKQCLVVASVMLLLVSSLFGEMLTLEAPRYFGRVVVELQAVFRDSATQWMVFICCAVYFITLELLRRRTTSGRFWHCRNPQVWVAAFLVFTGLHYAFNYKSASRSTYALMLIGGAVLGKAAAFWARWEAQKFRHLTQSPLSQGTSSGFATFSPSDAEKAIAAERVSAGPARHVFIGVLLVLLAAAALLKNETGLQFQYRGQERWTGPWDNPNIFGMLMGVGCVLALGQLVFYSGNTEPRTPNIEHRGFGRNVWRGLSVLFFAIAAVVCAMGLVKSYSRGAWLGVAVALGYLAWCWWATKAHLTLETHAGSTPHPSCGHPLPIRWGEGEGQGPAGSWLYRNWIPLSVLLLSVVILAFWNFRHTEHTTARRAFSAANINDFSWRNRMAAWEGALQMMASKPFVGFGWNQPERLYDQFYRAPKVTESAALQMNDYFTLGTTLGIPALVCFVAYVALSLRRSSQHGMQAHERHEEDSLSAPAGRGEGQGEVSAVGTNSGDCMSETGWKRCPTTDWLRATCRGGAMVLLIGFWFDGGLFKLATGSVFWILLELGRSERVELLNSESVNNVETL